MHQITKEHLACPRCSRPFIVEIYGDHTDATLYYVLGFLAGDHPGHSKRVTNLGGIRVMVTRQ